MAQTRIPYLIANSWAEISPIFAITQLREPLETEPVKEERTGPGWKHSRQKLPRQTVVG